VANDGFSKSWLEAHRVALGAAVTEGAIVGIGHVLDEVRSLLGKLAHPDVMASLGAEPPRGILLHGQPGTGKTLVARLLASSLGPEVPMYELSADELSPARIRGMFDHLAKAHERCVIYLDEIDLVALRRDLLQSDESKRLLVALLAGLDGLRSSAGPILVASSNRGPGLLDAALTRAGRLGVHIAFDLPDLEECAALFRHFLAGRPADADVEIDRLAMNALGLTPAEIRAIVDDATGLALADGRSAIRHDDLRRALKRDGEVLPEEIAADDPVKVMRTAIHEAGHAVVAATLRGGEWIERIQVSEHGGNTLIGRAGWSEQLLPADELRDAIVVGYGGIAAEEEVYGSASISATNDVERATTLACLVARAGQLDGAGAIDYGTIREFTGIAAPDAAAAIVTALLATARRKAFEIVRQFHGELHVLAGILAASGGVLSGDALRDALLEADLIDDFDDLAEDDEPDGDEVDERDATSDEHVELDLLGAGRGRGH